MSKKRKTKETLIYCGPTFTGELQQYSVFKGGIPKHIEEHIKKCPSIEKLLVPINALAKTRTNIKVQGKKENQFYHNIIKYQKGDK